MNVVNTHAHEPGDIGPTPETKRRLRSDVARKLHQQGDLRPAEMDAAEEIREAFVYLDGGDMGSHMVDLGVSRSSGPAFKPALMERMTPDLVAKVRRYRRWRQWADRELAGYLPDGLGAKPFTIRETVEAVVCHNVAPRHIERELPCFIPGHGEVVALVRKGLGWYAALAGWRM